MKSFLHDGVCPIRDILSRLGDKWSLLVLTTLNVNGTMRFNDIQKSIGDISGRMLSVTLRLLETDGLVYREVYPEVPPRVEDSLTKPGNALIPYLKNLVGWALENMHDLSECREKEPEQKTETETICLKQAIRTSA
jgi:DNA-binding HxlR family transcriptional regulator